MPSTPHGHVPDKSTGIRAPQIDEQLWAAIKQLIPPQWYQAEKQANEILHQAGVPRRYPALLGKIPDPSGKFPFLQVWIDDGEKIMVNHDMDYTEGANGYEDPKLCPKDVLVMDNTIILSDIDELVYNIYHEAVESADMSKGMDYEPAHERANAGEKVLRKRGLQSDEQLR